MTEDYCAQEGENEVFADTDLVKLWIRYSFDVISWIWWILRSLREHYVVEWGVEEIKFLIWTIFGHPWIAWENRKINTSAKRISEINRRLSNRFSVFNRGWRWVLPNPGLEWLVYFFLQTLLSRKRLNTGRREAQVCHDQKRMDMVGSCELFDVMRLTFRINALDSFCER